MKYQALSILQSSMGDTNKELKILHSQSALLTQHLVDCTSSTLEAISQSFENALDQVKYFHIPLTLSMEKIRPKKVIVYRKTV